MRRLNTSTMLSIFGGAGAIHPTGCSCRILCIHNYVLQACNTEAQHKAFMGKLTHITARCIADISIWSAPHRGPVSIQSALYPMSYVSTTQSVNRMIYI